MGETAQMMGANYFNAKYYTIVPDYPPRKGEIWLAEAGTEISPQIEDAAFLRHLGALGNANRSINSFLDYQFDKTRADKRDFLEHTAGIVANEQFTRPFQIPHRIFREFEDWLETKIKSTSIALRKIAEPGAPKKADPSFQDIVLKKDEVKKIIDYFTLKKMIDENNVWRGNFIELMALRDILREKDLIKNLKNAPCSRIISQFFKTEMHPKNYNLPIKNPVTEKISKLVNQALR